MKPVAARGPFFIIPSTKVLNDWLENGVRKSLYSARKITTSEKQVLLAISEHAPSSEENPITIVELAETLNRYKPETKITTLENQVRKIAANFADIAIFKREQKSLLGARKQSCFTMRSPEEALTELEDYTKLNNKTEAKKIVLPQERLKAMAAVRANLLNRKDIIYPVIDYNPSEPWSIQMITQLMERCSREHTRDKRKMIEAKISIGNKTANVVAHTTTNDNLVSGGVGLLTSSDAQTIMAIITLATQYIERAQEEGRPVINKIPLDVNDLCELLGKRKKGGSRDSLIRSLMRVIYTTFTITVKKDQDELNTFLPGELIGTETEFRLIKKHVVGIEGSGNKIKDETAYARRWFTLELDDTVWNSLVTGSNTRLVHPKLLFETNGYIHKLYAHIKLHTPINGTITRTMTELYSYFGYAGGVRQFKQMLRDKLLENTRIKPKDSLPTEGKVIDFFGYRVKVLEDVDRSGLTLIISLSEKEKGRIMLERKKLQKRQAANIQSLA